ncbi:phosphoribosylglycinamide formyltransferase [Clostridiales bacterium PH28_bin88]|nr:phosphoribosylglycinamide formyltransferase [Clostridiales bacterium PH28_bin88]
MDAIQNGELDASIQVVVSDRADAFALERARQQGIPAFYIDPKSFPTKIDYDLAVAAALEERDVELVVLAGYMRLVSSEFLARFHLKMVNIHPALLPAFPGLEAQRQAWEYGVKFSGCTVHFVDEGMDTGPVIAQAVVPVYDTDTAETLAERILEQEHRLYPATLQLIAEGRVEVVGRRVMVR